MKKTAFDIVKNQDLNSSVFVVTGGYSGLGAVSTRALLSAGANVVAVGRNHKSQADFVQTLRNEGVDIAKLDTSRTLDLASLESVADFAAYLKQNYVKIDCLMNNAGVMYTAPGKTKDGFETQMGVNVIGHFLLAELIAEKTERQVWLSSKGHTRLGAPRLDLEAIEKVEEETYNTRLRYQQSKLGNILLAKQFAIEHPHLLSVAVHPGLVKTRLSRNLTLSQKLMFALTNPRMVLSVMTPEQGASTQLLAATLPSEQIVNGAYYADCQVAEEAESARNMSDAKALFDYCRRATQAYLS